MFLQAVPLGVALLVGSCSLSVDVDAVQCRKDADCQAPYACGSAGLCQRAPCEVDAECRAMGDRFAGAICVGGGCERPECSRSNECDDAEVCDTEAGRCVRANQASCTRAADCARYEGNPVCIRSLNRCGASECETQADCGSSPTARCVNGACEDPTWGCLDEPDEREPNMSAAAELQVKVLYLFPEAGELETGVRNLKARVCAALDDSCSTAVTTDTVYDDNVLIVRGLENGKAYRIRITADHPSLDDVPLIDVEYTMYRTVLGTTVEPRPIYMFEDARRASFASLAGISVDPQLGTFLAYVLDCEGKEVEGVSISVDKITVGCGGDAQCGTSVFYMNASNVPDRGATKTNAAGRAGIVNLVPDVFNRVTLTRVHDDKRITSFVITPRPDVFTYTFFYPRDYGTASE